MEYGGVWWSLVEFGGVWWSLVVFLKLIGGPQGGSTRGVHVYIKKISFVFLEADLESCVVLFSGHCQTACIQKFFLVATGCYAAKVLHNIK